MFYFYLDQSSVVSIFENQVVTLSISGRHDKYIMNDRADFLSNVLNMFTNVHHLKFYQNLNYLIPSVLFHDQSSLFSSTLQELHINVYLFDGRLNQLCTLIINFFHVFPLRSSISDKVNYAKKKLITINRFF
jgi:hypothetical protein